MSNTFYGADGRFYRLSQGGAIPLSGEPQGGSSSGIFASAKMLSVDDMASATPDISLHE